MFRGELIIANSNRDVAVTNHSTFHIEQKMSSDKKSMTRNCFIEAEKLFFLDGEMPEGELLEGVIRLEIGEKEETQYFKGRLLSLSMGLAKIALDGELINENVEQFLKKIQRNEFIR